MKARDIVDVGAAVTKSPTILKEPVDQNAVTLDKPFEWREALLSVDQERYFQEVEIMDPEASYMEIYVRDQSSRLSPILIP